MKPILSLALLALMVGTVTTGQAQVVERGNFNVVIGGGAVMHPNHSALVPVSPILSLQGQMHVTENLGLGFALDYTRTSTDDDIFPYGQFQFPFADSTLLVALRQPVSVFQYQLTGMLGIALGDRLYPYVVGGVGGYTVYLDPQQNDKSLRQTDLAFTLGGAMKIGVGGSSSIELSVRDIVWTGFDRDLMNPMTDRTCRESGIKQFSGNVCPNERFPFLDPELSDSNWSEASETVHNLVFSVAFSFIPRL